MSVSQNEIERTSKRTKIGLAGAIKQGHKEHDNDKEKDDFDMEI